MKLWIIQKESSSLHLLFISLSSLRKEELRTAKIEAYALKWVIYFHNNLSYWSFFIIVDSSFENLRLSEWLLQFPVKLFRIEALLRQISSSLDIYTIVENNVEIICVYPNTISQNSTLYTFTLANYTFEFRVKFKMRNIRVKKDKRVLFRKCMPSLTVESKFWRGGNVRRLRGFLV